MAPAHSRVTLGISGAVFLGVTCAKAGRFGPEAASLTNHLPSVSAGRVQHHTLGSVAHHILDEQTNAASSVVDQVFDDEAAKWLPDPFGIRNDIVDRWGEVDPTKVLQLASYKDMQDDADAPYDLYQVWTPDGSRFVKRFVVTSELQAQAAKNEVKAVARLANHDIFLSFYGTTDATVGGSERSGMVFMTEASEGTLKDLLQWNDRKMDLDTLLSYFGDISRGVDTLRRSGIAHDTPTLDQIHIVGSMDDLKHSRATLCSSLTNTGLKVCGLRTRMMRKLSKKLRLATHSMKDLEQADVGGLGRILSKMLGHLEDSEHERFPELVRELDNYAFQLSNAGHVGMTRGTRLRAVEDMVKKSKMRLSSQRESWLAESPTRILQPKGADLDADDDVVAVIQETIMEGKPDDDTSRHSQTHSSADPLSRGVGTAPVVENGRVAMAGLMSTEDLVMPLHDPFDPVHAAWDAKDAMDAEASVEAEAKVIAGVGS